MIRSLRRQHRAMITVLAVLLTILFIAALLVRKPAPVNPHLPEQLLQTSSGGGR